MRSALILSALGCLVVAASVNAQLRADDPRGARPGPPPAAAGDPAIRRVAEDWKDAYNAGDAVRVASLYNEDGRYLSAHVSAHGREAIRAYFQKGIDAGGHIDAIRVIESRADGSLAYAVGTYEANNAGQRVDGRILLVLERRGDRWSIAAHQVVVRDQP